MQLKLTEHELMIASHLIAPSEIDVSWKDVGGLENVLDDIVETVIFPITKSKLLGNSKLTRPPKGKKKLLSNIIPPSVILCIS